MSSAAAVRHQAPPQETLRVAESPKAGLLKRASRLLRSELLIVPISHKGEEKQDYAQRWPAQAILSAILSTVAVVVMVIFSIFNAYSGTNRDATKELGDLRERVTKSEGRSENLQLQISQLSRENAELKATNLAADAQMRTIRIKLGMDIADGTVR